MSKAPTGIGGMEATADLTIAYNHAAHQLEVDQAHAEALVENKAFDTTKAIEARVVSPEVSALNDTAELEIYGSRGRTYTDPTTGAVIASPASPLKGKIEAIHSNPRFGTKQADRDKAAQKYEADLNQLLGDGYELTQAKLVLDLREADVTAHGAMVGKLVAGGMNPLSANKKAKDEYERKDRQRLTLIKNSGAFTTDDYARLRKGEDIYTNAAASTPPTPTVPMPAIAPPEFIPSADQARKVRELQGHESELAKIREEMAQMTINTRFGAVHGLRKRQEMKDLRHKYDIILGETVKARMEVAKEVLGAKEDDFDVATKAQMVSASLREELTHQKNAQLDEAKLTRYGKAVRWFNDRHLVTKMLITSGVALPAVAIGGLAGGVAGVAVARGVISGTRRGSLGHSSRKGSEKVLGKLGDKASKGIANRVTASVGAGASFEQLINAQKGSFKEEGLDRIKKSDTRRKTLSALATVALAFGGERAVEFAHDHLDWGPFGNHSARPGVKPAADTGAASADGLPGTVAGVARISNTEIVSQITPGQGLIENLTNPSIGLNPNQAAAAVQAMRAQGLLDGSHIAGVAERAGNVIVYARGAGDGMLHFDDPAVLKIITDAKNS